MLKILLYGIATFLETGIGIWFFGKMFPKRERMERRHYLTEWGFYTFLMVTVYTFPKTFLKLKDEIQYMNSVIFIYFVGLIIYMVLAWRMNKCPNMEVLFFVGMIISLTAQYWGSYFSMPVTKSGNIFPVLFLYCFYKCSFFQAYLWEFSYLIIMGMSKIIHITFWGNLEGKYFKDYFLSLREHTHSEVFWWIVTCVIMYYLLRFGLSKIVIEKFLMIHKKILLAANIVLILIMDISINYGAGKIENNYLSVILSLFVGFILFLIIIFVKAYGNIVEKEKFLLNVRNSAIQTQYEEMSVSYEKYRQLVHDEKHMVSYVAECLRKGENKTAAEFLQNFQDTLVAREGKIWSRIKSLNLILNIKYRKMEEAKIKFLCNLNVEYIPMEESDFVILMGNLLDNAIEASEKCPEGERFIELNMKNMNQMFMLKIKNSCMKKASRDKMRFVTDKEEKEKHGLGIASAQYIVNQYNGEMDFAYDDKTFEVKILINNVL